MWTLLQTTDNIRLASCGLSASKVDAATQALFGAVGIGKPVGDVRLLYKRKQSLRSQIRQEMPTFDAQGLVGDVPPQEVVEAGSVGGDDRVGDETTPAEPAREVIVLDGDDGGRGSSPGPLIAHSPLEDSDAEEGTVPLEARLRRRAVYSDEGHGGADEGAGGEETSLRRCRSEEAMEAGSSAQAHLTPRLRVKKRPWLLVNV